MTRRQFLAAGLGWFPLFWRRNRLSMAGIHFRIERRGSSARRYLWIHGDETTARDVLLEHLKTHRGTAFLISSAERHVPLMGGRLDPNRMFSREGAEANLRRVNSAWTEAMLRRALDRLDRDREKFIRAVLPPPGGLLIAVHNNIRGYSVRDEVPISDRVSLADPEHPHEFLLATDAGDFEKLARSGFNAVFQHSAPKTDDGSFSRAAARHHARYVNIEARIGESERQRRMLEWVERNLD